MVNSFSYLTVMISIILGLGITHLLGGIARCVSRRATMTFYWPSLVWMAALLILIIQVWWVDFSLSRQTQWTLGGFVSTLLIPAALYFMSFLIVPEGSDMRATFFENRVWFFSFLIAVPLFGSLQQLFVEGHIHQDVDSAAKGLGLLLSFGALLLKSDKAQKIFAIVGAVFVVVYVWGLFYRLPLSA